VTGAGGDGVGEDIVNGVEVPKHRAGGSELLRVRLEIQQVLDAQLGIGGWFGTGPERGIFCEFLGRVAHEGASLLLVEQYVTRALALADYVYLMNRGQIAYRGEPSELEDEDVFARYLGAEVGAGD
jgi:ABC-type uncharacterized transport system ATPase subunit